MNSVFENISFWEIFYLFEDAAIEETDFEKLINELPSNYKRETIVRSQPKWFFGQTKEYREKKIVFNIDVCNKYQLLLECDLQVGGSEKHLYLVNTFAHQKKMLIGIWNVNQGLPYCLRLEELFTIISYYTENQYLNKEIILLLLADFVGLKNDIEKSELMQVLVETFRSLKIDHPNHLLKNATLLQSNQSIWENTAGKGYEYLGNNHTCYSLRNKTFSSSSVYSFPFKDFTEMMSLISKKESDSQISK